MKITQYERLDDCKDGSLKYSIVFDSEFSESFIKSFSEYHIITIRDDFEKPYFKIDYPGFYALKGTVGSMHAKLWINKGSFSEWEKYFLERSLYEKS